MTRSREVVAFCGATSRSGKCGLPAGWGTDHPQVGHCRHHGGSSPNGRKYAARIEASTFMGAGDALPDVDPTDALLYTVRRKRQTADYCRLRAAALQEDEQTPDGDVAMWVRLEDEHLRDLNRFAKAALDAGVAERRVQLAERTGALLAAAIEDALTVFGDAATPKLRALFVAKFSSRVAVLEAAADDVIEGTAA